MSKRTNYNDDDLLDQHVVDKKMKMTPQPRSDDDSSNDSESDDSSEESNNLSNDDLDEWTLSEKRPDVPVDEKIKMAIPEDEREELERCKGKADKGDVDAMVEVAHIYSEYEETDEALRYYKMAASRGNLEALEELAEIYDQGLGVPEDENRALHYYEQAADRGSVTAMWQVALAYQLGNRGATKDFDKALHYLKGAAAGNKDARHTLALHYQGRDCNGEEIHVAEVYEAKAFHLFLKNAEQNYEDSMYELGRCYRDGKGTPRDPVKAKEWFGNASVKGHDRSLFALAMMVVDEGLTDQDKKTIDDLIESWGTNEYDVRKEWFNWYSKTRAGTSGQKVNNDMSSLQNLDWTDATYLLARLLASEPNHNNVRIAESLVSRVEDQHDRHGLFAWLKLLVENLREETEALSQINLRRERTFDVQKEVRPIALIGQGQFGKVYLAQLPDRISWISESSGGYVAIKFVDITLAHQDKVLARNVVREQFACRVLDAKRIKNTVEYLGFTDVVEHRQRGLVFKLCADLSEVEILIKQERQKIDWDAPVQLKGQPDWKMKVPSSLRSCVVFPKKGSRKWTPAEVIIMLRTAAEALREVHKLGFIHRDIAPRNILCDAKGNIQLADFGWAKFVGSSYDDASLLADYGKACFSDKHRYALAWWAPECFGRNANFSWNSDVYAFGITMWMCFSHEDPFSDIEDPESIQKEILEKNGRPCIKKRPSEGGVLDRNTPDDLIKLIKFCWKRKAEDRPTLDHVIEELRRIKTDLQNCQPSSGRRSYEKEAQEYWNDEKRIYKPLKGNVTNFLKDDQYDVFLVHAGEKKMDTVETMKKTFQQKGGLKCFLDCDMTLGSDPTGSMRLALSTCRYAVVVFSSEFFEKRHPASELMYAFQRMKWIRQQNYLQGWNSLIVVLYNMTVQEYKDGQRADDIKLPESLCSEVVLVEWSGLGKIPWRKACSKMCKKIIKQDKKKNVLDKWVQFLENYSSKTLPSDFPSPDALY